VVGFRCVAETQVDQAMIEIKAGKYPIGGLENFYFNMIRELDDSTTGNEKRDLLGEAPVTASLDPFYIDMFEVSVDDYAQFLDMLDDNPQLQSSLRPDQMPYANIRYMPSTWEEQLRDDRNLPVTGVSWHMATAYCYTMGKRLPTLYEFEFLMGGEEQHDLFATGPAWDRELLHAAEYAENGRVNVRELSHRALVPIKQSQYKHNFGVYHLFGNVEEWVDDPRYMSGQYAYIKGGNFEHLGYYKTFRYFKQLTEKNSFGNLTGFRCAKNP
jgi:formylglycine-generating enzyme required for sulfatase activity